MDIRRTVLWMIFSFSLLLLWNNWQVHNGKPSLFGGNPTASHTAAAPKAATAPGTASTDVPPAVVRALQTMQVGQVYGVIEAGDTLEIVKLLANDNGKLKAAHISFKLTPIAEYVARYQKTHPVHRFIKVQ